MMLDSELVLTDVWLPGEPRSYLSTSRRMMKRAAQETAMNDKTIILSLLRKNRPEYQRLVQAKQLAPTLDRLAQELRERHGII
jgi:ATP-dependent exoDNAse (exonuclease V) alpha subunit